MTANEQTYDELSAREKEVAILVARDFKNTHIAKSLGITERAVDGHRERIHKKLHTCTPIGLAMRVVELGWYDPRSG